MNCIASPFVQYITVDATKLAFQFSALHFPVAETPLSIRDNLLVIYRTLRRIVRDSLTLC